MNQHVFTYIHAFAGRNPIIDGLVIFFAVYPLYFLVLGFLLLVIFQKGARRKWYLFCEGALATLLARGLVAQTIYHFYNHVRPFVFYGFAPLIAESGPSFPSGHVIFLFALSTVVWFINKKWGIVYFLLSLACGLARIYVGVHWPLDIAGGIVIGIVCAFMIHGILTQSRRAIYRQRSA